MSIATLETLSTQSYYQGLLDSITLLEDGIYRASANGENPAIIENEKWRLLVLREELRELEAQGYAASY